MAARRRGSETPLGLISVRIKHIYMKTRVTLRLLYTHTRYVEGRSSRLRCVDRGEVPVPPVAQHGHNRVSGSQLPRSAHGTNAVESSRATDEEALLREQVLGHRLRLAVRHAIGGVDLGLLEIRRHTVNADALDDRVVPSSKTQW